MWISERRLRRYWNSTLSILGLKVIIINIDYMGLGNRLKLLANFDINYGLDQTTLLWNRQGWVNCALRDIIEIEGVRGFREYAIPLNRFIVPIICHPTKPYWRERGFWRFDVGDDLPERFWIERNGLRFPSIDFWWERTPSHDIERYIGFFQRLTPTGVVRDRIAQVDVGPGDVCVQVRNTVDPDDRANVPRLESFLERMKQFPRHTKFFISTLDSSISQVFHGEFGNRIIELPTKRYRSMVDATADMFLLAKGNTLMVSRGSTFGEVAWWLGGCRQTVVEMVPEIFPE